MSYLGRGVDKISNIEMLDNIISTEQQATLTKGGVNFVPTSAQQYLYQLMEWSSQAILLSHHQR